ncbi:MAG: hypothetical protein RJQ00_06460 [Vicingaceae bacterium]
MGNDGQYKMNSKPKEESSKGNESKIPLLNDKQKGLISIGVVAGAALAISKKKGMLAILGYMWLGSIAGGGLAYLFKKEMK